MVMPMARPRTVAVVDDDESILFVIRKTLERQDDTVVTSKRPELTLPAIEQDSIDILPTDNSCRASTDAISWSRRELPDLRCGSWSWPAAAITRRRACRVQMPCRSKPFDSMALMTALYG